MPFGGVRTQMRIASPAFVGILLSFVLPFDHKAGVKPK
jgi:hypothetical protein